MFKQEECSKQVQCYICDNILTNTSEWKNILLSRTKYSDTDFYSMIGQVIGTSSLFHITTDDYVCGRCDRFINRADKYLEEVKKCKDFLLKLVRKKYEGEKRDSRNIINNVSKSEIVLLKNDFICILCDHKTYSLELLQKHITSHDYKNDIPSEKSIVQKEYSCYNCYAKFFNADEMNSHLSKCVNIPKLSNEISINPIRKINPKESVDALNVSEEILFLTEVNVKENVPSNQKSPSRTIRLKNRTVNKENNKSDVLAHLIETIKCEDDLIEYAPLSDKSASVYERSKCIKKELYMCHICKYRTYKQESMREHIRTHRQDYVECSICKKLFKNSKTLKRHLQTHITVVCNICNKDFSSAAVYNEHVLLYHSQQEQSESDEKLNILDLSFEAELFTESMDVIEDNPSENHNFCTLCGILVTDNDHQCKRTESSAVCEPCGVECYTEEALRKHYVTEHKEPFCQYCGKEITPIQKLLEHERRHLKFDSLNLNCPTCPKKFRTQTGLDYHMAKHTGNYKTYCEICNKGFMSQKFLEEHMGVHTKEDRYVCDICGKKFCFNSTYRMHRLWHKNPLPYECDICGEKFNHSSVRKLHIRRIHTGERPYTCSYCNKSFLRATVLKKHLMQHTHEYSFNCESCNKGFTTRHKYGIHLAKVHKDSSLLEKRECQYKMAINPSERNQIIKDEDEPLEQSDEAIFLAPDNVQYTFIDTENQGAENMTNITTQNYFEGFKYEIVTDAELEEYVVMADGQINNTDINNQNIIIENYTH